MLQKIDYNNPMRRQIQTAPEIILKLYETIEPTVRTILSTPEIYSVKKIVLTGAGDCLCAAMSCKPSFESLLGIPVEVVPPLDLACYYQMKWVGESPCDPLVIAMSSSGSAIRVVEAAKAMRAHNALTIAVTKNADSPLAKACERTLLLDYPNANEPAPGTASYAAMMLVCYLLAIRFCEVRLKYTMDEANEMRGECLKLMSEISARFDGWDNLAFDAAQQWKDASSVEAVGCGYESGSAQYVHAKSYEAIGIPANYCDSENWFHINYFLKQIAQTLTIVFAEKENHAVVRTRELIARMEQMNREFVLVSNDTIIKSKWLFELPQIKHLYFMPLLHWVPAALIISYIAALRGETYNRGFRGIWEESLGVPSTTTGKMLSVGETEEIRDEKN